MAFKMFSVGLVLVFVGMCLSQQQPSSGSSSQYQPAVSQASFQIGSAAAQQAPQTKLEDIERDSLVAGFGQKTQQQTVKPSSSTPTVPQQQSYQSAAVPQQYFVQPFQTQQPQFYMQPYQAQPYQMAFDYAGVQYMIVPNTYNLNNQVYQQYYTPSAPQPSAVPQYVTKQSSSDAAQSQPEYKQQEYKQQQFTNSAQGQQEYKQQYVASAPAYQYVQQPTSAAASPADYSYITRHPSFKAQTVPAAAIQPQFQYSAIPQQYQQYQQPQYYYMLPAGQSVAAEQPRIQQSAKSQFSSGVKSTTPFPLKESFSYKFESSPLTQQQQQSSATYSTLKYSV